MSLLLSWWGYSCWYYSKSLIVFGNIIVISCLFYINKLSRVNSQKQHTGHNLHSILLSLQGLPVLSCWSLCMLFLSLALIKTGVLKLSEGSVDTTVTQTHTHTHVCVKAQRHTESFRDKRLTGLHRCTRKNNRYHPQREVTWHLCTVYHIWLVKVTH